MRREKDQCYGRDTEKNLVPRFRIWNYSILSEVGHAVYVDSRNWELLIYTVHKHLQSMEDDISIPVELG